MSTKLEQLAEQKGMWAERLYKPHRESPAYEIWMPPGKQYADSHSVLEGSYAEAMDFVKTFDVSWLEECPDDCDCK